MYRRVRAPSVRVRVRVRVRVYERQEYPHRRTDAIPTTVLQRRTSRAHTGLVGGVRSGARAHQGLAPFLHRYPPPPPPPLPAHRHAFRLSLKPERTARDHPSRARGVFSPISLSISFFSLLFCSSERRICVCHMTISNENIVEWLLNPFSRGEDSASSGDPLSPVTSAQTSPG